MSGGLAGGAAPLPPDLAPLRRRLLWAFALWCAAAAASPLRAGRVSCERLGAGGPPRLSLRDREPVQLQVLVERTRRETGRALGNAELASAFADRLRLWNSCEAAEEFFPLGRPAAEVEAGRLVLEVGRRRASLSCEDDLIGRLAAAAVDRLAGWSTPAGRPRRVAERWLWAAWVDAVLDRAGSPFTDYRHADELQAALGLARAPDHRLPALEWLVDAPVAYLRLRRFEAGTARELEAALEEAQQRGARALVLDLRDNAGGRYALDPLAIFLPEGAVLVKRRHVGDADFVTLRAGRDGPCDWPLAILVNEGTASMAELFAASLRAAGRGVLVGARTWGKALDQRLHAVGDEGLLLLDAHEHVDPRTGEPWTGRGLEPDDLLDPGTPPDPLRAHELDELARRDAGVAAALRWLRSTS